MKIRDRILIIEDEANISNFIATILNANDYDAMTARTGSEAITTITSHCPDLILLDLGLPDMDGANILKFVREWSTCPIIVVSARNHERDKVDALDAGADDYIVKPFSPGEVMARVRAVLRRIDRGTEAAGKVLRVQGLCVNLEDYSVSVDSLPVRLTKREVDMLWTLVQGRNRAYTREMLLDLLWGYDYYGDPRTVDSHMKRLRAKLDVIPHPAWEIRTIRNVGYKFEVLP